MWKRLWVKLPITALYTYRPMKNMPINNDGRKRIQRLRSLPGFCLSKKFLGIRWKEWEEACICQLYTPSALLCRDAPSWASSLENQDKFSKVREKIWCVDEQRIPASIYRKICWEITYNVTMVFFDRYNFGLVFLTVYLSIPSRLDKRVF